MSTLSSVTLIIPLSGDTNVLLKISSELALAVIVTSLPAAGVPSGYATVSYTGKEQGLPSLASKQLKSHK